MRAIPRLLRLLVLPLLLPTGAALAQSDSPGIIRPNAQTPAAPGPAPALPGLAARRAPAPIPGDPTASLAPNEALFDAINRGDLAAAREAVGRGANLGARNALGLTPLDAAVDQGRNDIAFYLLSTRDLSQSPPPPPSAGLAAPPVGRAAAPAPRAPVARLAPAPVAAAPARPRNAPLWANDGGTPRPEIGFLGFDAGRPAGATPPGRGGRS